MKSPFLLNFNPHYKNVINLGKIPPPVFNFFIRQPTLDFHILIMYGGRIAICILCA